MDTPTFPLNAWYAVAWDTEVKRALLPRTVGNKKLVFYRTAAGQAVALEDACWHRLAPLSLGRLRGDDVVCGYHGLAYNARGRCVFMPSQETISSRCTWVTSAGKMASKPPGQSQPSSDGPRTMPARSSPSTAGGTTGLVSNA